MKKEFDIRLRELIKRVMIDGICNEYSPEGTTRKPWTQEGLGAASTITRKTLRNWSAGGSFSSSRLEQFCDRLAAYPKGRELDEDEIVVLEQLRELARQKTKASETSVRPINHGPSASVPFSAARPSSPPWWRQKRKLTMAAMLLPFLLIALNSLGMFSSFAAPKGIAVSFKDCGNCPKMRIVPAGTFRAGSPSSEGFRDYDEDLSAPISMESFAVSEREISNGEFNFFKRQTGYKQADLCQKLVKDTGWFWVRDYSDNIEDPNWPEGCISFDDASAYVEWLNTLVEGKPYKVPNQIEWEYVARGGSETRYFWGDDPNESCEYANLADQSALRSYPGWDEVVACDDGEDDGSSSGGQYLPNDFGIFDTTGSLMEWTSSCFDVDEYISKNGGLQTGEAMNCSEIYIRGGSWGTKPSNARIADFRVYDRDKRHQQHGFRVMRSLP